MSARAGKRAAAAPGLPASADELTRLSTDRETMRAMFFAGQRAAAEGALAPAQREVFVALAVHLEDGLSAIRSAIGAVVVVALTYDEPCFWAAAKGAIDALDTFDRHDVERGLRGERSDYQRVLDESEE